jgi:hypothetical protein
MMTIVRVAVAVLLLASALSAQTIHLADGTFRVAGWKPGNVAPEDLAAVFSVYAGGADAPPMLGTYSVEGGSLIFRPRFPLAAGLRYRAVFRPPGRSPVEAFFDGPKKDQIPTTRVVHVYPSANVLPGNQLRFYIYFSAPMSIGEWKRRVHLVEQDGNLAVDPFLESADELWDPAYQRLTVYFDPGRIKRRLIPNTELGPPLVEGKQYTLVIDREFADDRGVPLSAGFTKTFRAGAPVRVQLNPKQWHLGEPKAGTLDPLTIDFPRMMDFALAQRLISVPNVAGTVSMDRNETRWTYTPDEPWKAGQYHVEIDPSLEDVSGNRMDHVFDTDVSETPSEPVATGTTSLTFRLTP